jgi:hypothetical protein
VPTNDNIIAWVIVAIFGLLSTLIGALLKSVNTKLDDILKELRTGREVDIKERSTMAAAIALLSFKIKYPEVNVSDEANQIANRHDEKKYT